MMIVISLGWGAQSTTLAAMAALGVLGPVDAAINADTTYESVLTYQYAARLAPWLEERGVRVVKVEQDPRPDLQNVRGGVDIPAFTDTENGGRIHRQCTYEWKIRPIRRWLQANRNGEPVEQWIGISTDEALRMKTSDVKYITNRWPLIELGMSRMDCVAWLQERGIEIPPRSACVFCPYHSAKEWQLIKATPADWRAAVEADRAIRKARPPYDLFVHPSRKPLEDVDLRTAEERGQMRLWDEECSGLCGV